MDYIKNQDSEVFEAIEKEKYRQQTNIELIASENFVSNAVLETIGCVMTNKYAEGYPGARYYGGCENVDVVEVLTQERIKKLFNVKYANVQPHSGSQANMAVYKALLNYGYKLSFSGQDYECHSYGLNKETEQLDYDDIEKIAMEIKPKMIIAGASAYSRFIDFKRFSKIKKKVGAYLFVDMAHIAGLVATGLHQNPCDYADVVTSTTHKTLRGPRGGIILTNNLEIYKKINKAVFPGIQGGPLMNIIAAKAVAFKEDLDPSFHIYAERVIKNAKAFAGEFEKLGYRIVSGGTDNHLFMIDIFNSIGVTGLEAETLLHSVNITVNKNTIPNETLSAKITSGIRLGTPAMTTRGFTEEDFKKVAHLIDAKLKKTLNDEEIKKEVKQLTDKYPLWY